MKKFIARFIIFAVFAALVVIATVGAIQPTITTTTAQMAVSTVTYKQDLSRIRATDDEDYADLTAATTTLFEGSLGDFANKPTSDIKVIKRDNAVVEIYMCGTNAENDTFGYVIKGCSITNGPIEVLGHGTATLGSQDVVLYPHDGSTATNAYWVDTFSHTDGKCAAETTDMSAVDGVATLRIDVMNIYWLWVDIYTADGSTGTEAGDVTVYISIVN